MTGCCTISFLRRGRALRWKLAVLMVLDPLSQSSSSPSLSVLNPHWLLSLTGCSTHSLSCHLVDGSFRSRTEDSHVHRSIKRQQTSIFRSRETKEFDWGEAQGRARCQRLASPSLVPVPISLDVFCVAATRYSETPIISGERRNPRYFSPKA